MIEGLSVKPLKQISDGRGKVMHMLKADAPEAKPFGEIYFSSVNPGVVKAWKMHSKMTQHYAVPVGKIRLVVFDGRPSSRTKGNIETIDIGEDCYALVTIPPLVWYGFKGTSAVPSLIANFTDLMHDPGEVERADIKDSRIPYDWDK